MAAVAVALLAGLLVACVPMAMPGDHHRGMHGGGDDTRTQPQVELAGPAAIDIQDFSFRPGNVRIPVGTTVTWTNRDSVAHTATAVDGSWNTGLLAEGESGEIVFDRPGVYDYRCLPHPDMKARIEVYEP